MHLEDRDPSSPRQSEPVSRPTHAPNTPPCLAFPSSFSQQTHPVLTLHQSETAARLTGLSLVSSLCFLPNDSSSYWWGVAGPGVGGLGDLVPLLFHRWDEILHKGAENSSFYAGFALPLPLSPELLPFSLLPLHNPPPPQFSSSSSPFSPFPPLPPFPPPPPPHLSSSPSSPLPLCLPLSMLPGTLTRYHFTWSDSSAPR